ncbi:MAG: hypothetical protein IPI96_15685 [Saprospiraceae bacterium]|nr:hypothetical protein [Saprospiraceae bacterium]
MEPISRHQVFNGDYTPENIQRIGLQVLETIHFIGTSKAIDTIIGRYAFLLEILDTLKNGQNNSRYLSDIQECIDMYKLMYYDKMIQDYELALVISPNNFDLIDFYCKALFDAFKSNYEEHSETIKLLKREKAIANRKNKIKEIAKLTIDELNNNCSSAASFSSVITELGMIEIEITTENISTYPVIELNQPQSILNASVSSVKSNNSIDEFISQIENLKNKTIEVMNQPITREGLKENLIVPFLQLLGYDLFRSDEELPDIDKYLNSYEKQKIDFVLINDKTPLILVQVYNNTNHLNLLEKNSKELLKAINSKVLILTNGIKYNFYSSYNEEGYSSEFPFMEFDITKIEKWQIINIWSLYRNRMDHLNFVLHGIYKTKPSDKIFDINMGYIQQSEKFNQEAAKKLKGKTLKLYLEILNVPCRILEIPK